MAVEAFDASDMESQMSASIVLVGAALAIAAVIGVLQPPGHRGGALLAIAAGAGVGIAGLGLGVPSLSEGTDRGVLVGVPPLVHRWVRHRDRRPPADVAASAAPG
jgi:hypothetical protein